MGDSKTALAGNLFLDDVEEPYFHASATVLKRRDKTGKRTPKIKSKDDVLETGVYFNGPLFRFEAWKVTGNEKRLVGWIGLEACVSDPGWKEYWDKYVWEEYLIVDKTTPKDLLEKLLE